MKRSFTLFSVLFFFFCSKAQIFNGNSGTINNLGQDTYFTINVSGLNPANIDSVFGFEELCLDITHPAVEELHIALKSPSGVVVEIAHGASSKNGANYAGTCFNNTALTSITTIQSPRTGSFKPMGYFGRFNTGKAGNGVWTLIVKDYYANATAGTLNSWSIKFGGTAPAHPVIFTSSNLPIVMINTNNQTISETEKLIDLKIIDNGANRNNITDVPNNFNGKSLIKVRGSSSKMFEKLSYKLDLKDASGINILNASILGMPSESDWVLTASYTDKTFIRNTLTAEIFRQMGHYAARSRYVEVVVNGEYQGLYILTEKPKRGPYRINIEKLGPTEDAFPDVTGGYIVQIDRIDEPGWYSLYPGVSLPNTPAKFYYQYNYPKPDEITPTQKNYIKVCIDSLETIMQSPNFSDPHTGYRKYINVETFVDFLIINEFSKNADAYRFSTYLFKDNIDQGGKFSIGPVWDYDLGWHNCNYGNAFDEKFWQFDIPNTENAIPLWWQKLMQDTYFKDKLNCRYRTFRLQTINNATLYSFIDQQAALIAEARARNFRQFPVIGAYIYPNPQDQSTATPTSELNDLKAWIASRSAWLDANMPGACADVGVGENNSEEFYLNSFPSPFSTELNIQFEAIQKSAVSIELTDLLGKKVFQISKNLDPGIYTEQLNTSGFPSGTYIARLTLNNKVYHKKLLKTEDTK